MVHDKKGRVVLSFNNDSFKHYLLLKYVSKASDPEWEEVGFVTEKLISPEFWIQLQDYARADVESQGGKLIGYEMVNEELVSHEKINSDLWPTNWMWVIQKQNFQ
ncbi:hypothetical protein [Dyadobacter sediminis]|uniref:Uncharacterized protein n=1 Tax=Dyadobacter sediminis TaxID=1493691 RepID=A0A5R9K7K4_9BACT|nr:hypothetical protein [Dyadobacter sediminis]TLU89831.1 hypothetical protein FEM55_20055 [Dyadobacter sediminis]GGC12449.1 hypothetical protein GCM10011325_44130 [Dyadobacter sediminis]